jgi:hypothetical protein
MKKNLKGRLKPKAKRITHYIRNPQFETTVKGAFQV